MLLLCWRHADGRRGKYLRVDNLFMKQTQYLQIILNLVPDNDGILVNKIEKICSRLSPAMKALAAGGAVPTYIRYKARVDQDLSREKVDSSNG